MSNETIWQIGKLRGRLRYSWSGPWTAVFDYSVQQDANPINRPAVPRYFTLAGSARKYNNSMEKLRILFSLDRDYEALVFVLPNTSYLIRLGVQVQLFLNGTQIDDVTTDTMPLGAVSAGDHVLELSFTGTYRKPIRLQIMSLEGLSETATPEAGIY